MNTLAPAASWTAPRYIQAADVIRAQIADGTLKPGSLAPSGAAIARMTGFSQITGRKALRSLIMNGTLVPGPSRNARPRVAVSGPPADEAGSRLSAEFASRRYAAGLTQHELAVLIGYSVTTVGHAETGRTWQGRRFWDRADGALAASGALLRLYDTCRAADALPGQDGPTEPAPGPVCVLAVWGDGSVVTVPRHLADLVAAELRTIPG